MFSRLARLECTKCGASSERGSGANLCAKCGGPLFARYETGALDRDSGASRPRTIWRWHELMPVADPANIVSLGEGGTPLLPAVPRQPPLQGHRLPPRRSHPDGLAQRFHRFESIGLPPFPAGEGRGEGR